MKPKAINISERIAKAFQQDSVRFSVHALKRIKERLSPIGLDELDVFRILKKGKRESEKDKWDSEYQEWTYAIQGKTLDGNLLRVCISFKSNGLIIVTVIEI